MASRTGPGIDRATAAAFSAAVVIGGVNFLAVKVSNEHIEPMFGAALRFGAASLLLFAATAILRRPRPDARAAFGAAVYGWLGFGVSYGLLYFALVGLSAGTTSVIVAAAPLATLILAVAHRQERWSGRGFAGGLLVLAGIAILSRQSIEGDIPFGYFAAALGGVLAIGESTVVAKMLPRPDPVTTNAVGMGVGAAFLVGASLVRGETWALPADARTWLVLAWLVIAGSIALFVLMLFVIQRWTASAGAYAVTLMPVVAVTLGTVLADEELTIDIIVGGVLVLVAVYVGALSGARAAPVASPEPAVLTSSDASPS